MAVTELNLFAGTGAMSLGLRAAIPGIRTVGYVEWDAYAATALLARMEGEALDSAPVFVGDVYDFDARLYRGRVDLVSASPPCQPYSVAGRRGGNDDERSHGDGRGPIIGMLNVIEAVRPAFVFFENVSAWVTAGHFRSVRGRLRDLGYECEEPLLLRAADVGAPHRRERVFVLAYREGGGFGERGEPPRSDRQSDGGGETMADASRLPSGERAGRERVFDSGEGVENPECPERRQEHGPCRTEGSHDVPPRTEGAGGAGVSSKGVENPDSGQRDGSGGTVRARRPAVGGTGETVGDAENVGHERGQGSGRKARGRSQHRGAGVADSERPGPQGQRSVEPQWRGESVALHGAGPADALFPPDPGDTEAWQRILADNPSLEPAICRVADGMAYRMDRLRCTGNGVVPLQASVAFAVLFAGLELEVD